MTEATWGDATAPSIDWKMSVSLENVTRAGAVLPEVTNLEAAVRAWQDLDPARQAVAVLTLERPVRINGDLPLDHFIGQAIDDLAKRLPE